LTLSTGIIFVISTVYYWGDSPTGISALLILCGGDGFADLVGRKFGRHKLPHNRAKSWEGSVAFLLASIVLQVVFVHLFHTWGWFPTTAAGYLAKSVWLSAVGCVVESLPFGDWDNGTVFVAVLCADSLRFY